MVCKKPITSCSSPDLVPVPPPVPRLVTGHTRDSRGDEVWDEHGHADWLLVYTLSGRGRFGHAYGEILCLAGDVVLIRPHTMHDYGAVPPPADWETVWAYFHPRPEWYPWLYWPQVAPGVMRLRLGDPGLSTKVVSRLLDMHHLATGALPLRDAFALNALEEALLWCDLENPDSEQSHLDPRVRRAMDYLCRNLSNAITLEMLAETIGLSVSRLAHLFREHVGMTPQQFLEHHRLSRARQLLERTPHSIQAIAAAVGFDNPFYFSLRFKRQTGLCPRDYRRRTMSSWQSIDASLAASEGESKIL
jgi:AraC family transcriptional regulator of arabinose operon